MELEYRSVLDVLNVSREIWWRTEGDIRTAVVWFKSAVSVVVLGGATITTILPLQLQLQLQLQV